MFSFHHLTDKEIGTAEEGARFRYPTRGDERSDVRAAYGDVAYDDGGDDDDLKAFLHSKSLQKRDVSLFVTPKSEMRADDDRTRTELAQDNVFQKGFGTEGLHLGEVNLVDLTDVVFQKFPPGPIWEDQAPFVAFHGRESRREDKGVGDRSERVYLPDFRSALQDRLMAKMNAVEGSYSYRCFTHHSLLSIPHGTEREAFHQETSALLAWLDRTRALLYNPFEMRIERIADLSLEEDLPLSTLRPSRLAEFINQESIKEKLRIYIAAAQGRDEPLDHVILHSPPGLGKTTLAHIIAAEMGVNIRVSSGPAIEKAGDLAALLTNLQPRDVFFIDEIHRLRRNVEEILYPAMEDYKIDIILGEGPNAQSLRIDLPPFTLIGATTRAGLISAPLRDRFEVAFRLGFYGVEDLSAVILRNGKLLGVEVAPDGARELAKRARGTPRIANRLLRRTRDYAEVKKDGRIDLRTAQESLELLGIDERGLDRLDRAVLDTVISKFNGGPVGLETLAAALSEEKDTLTDVVEPYLIQEGFIQRTSQGRITTDLAYSHLKKGRDRLI